MPSNNAPNATPATPSTEEQDLSVFVQNLLQQMVVDFDRFQCKY